MSYQSQRTRNHHSDIQNQWVWIILASIVGILLLSWLFSGDDSDSKIDISKAHIMVSPLSDESTVFIARGNDDKVRLTGSGGTPLYPGVDSISVENGGATLQNSEIQIQADERTEIKYTSHSGSMDTFSIKKGRAWIEYQSGDQTIELINMRAHLDDEDLIMVEQTANQIHSTIYAIRGDIEISTQIGSITLSAGDRILISSSDLVDTNKDLKTLTAPINANDMLGTPLFVRNNGTTILSLTREQQAQAKNTESTATGTIENTGSVILQNSHIKFLEPTDGSTVTKSPLTLRGTIHSTDVKRIVINDQEATVSPVAETFSLNDIAITTEYTDIVYKVYNAQGSLLEKGVITVRASKQLLQTLNKPVSNSSPVSSKDFRIIFPDTNPFVTTDSAIKVQGSVPANSVSYITINGYRLQKFVAGSTNWYYHASIPNKTLQDGINLYTIKFFGNDNALLYTQLFTIIKENPHVTISGEIR